MALVHVIIPMRGFNSHDPDNGISETGGASTCNAIDLIIIRVVDFIVAWA